MAVIARRSWSTLLTEFLKASGGINYSTWSARAEYLLYESYLDICLLWHHYELDATALFTLQADEFEIATPGDAYVVWGLVELDSSNRPTRFLQNRAHALAEGSFRFDSTGRPSYFSRFGNKCLLDQKVDQARTYRVMYYRYPAAPDFTSTTTYPEFATAWDTHFMEAALVKAGVRTGNPALASLNGQLLLDWVKLQAQPQLTEGNLSAQPDTPLANKPLGGLQG